jgi:hypothetical protein
MARRLFLLLLLVGGGLLLWKPQWRAATFAYAGSLLRQVKLPGLPGRPRVVAQEPGQATHDERPGTGAAGGTNAEPAPETPETPEEPVDEKVAGGEPQEVVTPTGNLSPSLPRIAAGPALPAELRLFQQTVQARPSAAGFRQLADRAAAKGFPEVAAAAYLREAEINEKTGDTNAAVVERLKAGQYRSEASLFVDLPAEEVRRASQVRLAPLEPLSGTLLGAFIDRDDQLPTTFMDENWQTHRDPEEFAERVGKKHATLFCYLQYGKPFPFKWANRLGDAGVVPHLAWEPRSLAEVTESSLAPFAESLARFDSPVFIRFAGEMNGDWTRYHGDPPLYRQKFRLVSRVLKERAPKAALIWCVNSVPLDSIDSYYPGDDAVDWVGVNLYNVLFFDNDRTRPADRVHPADLLAPIYKRYAARKPIALCEYAASHQAAIDPKPRPELAAARLSQMYAALPRLFPRVKLIDWFNCNNLKHARPDRQLNNYSVTDHPQVLSAYQRAISAPSFLSEVDEQPEVRTEPLREGQAVSGIVTLSAWVRTHLDRPRVYLLAGGKVLHAGDEPGPYLCRWDTRKLPAGSCPVRLVVLDREGRLIRDVRQTVRVRAPEDEVRSAG